MTDAAAPEVVGLIAAPGAPAERAGRLPGPPALELAVRNPQLSWSIPVVEDPLVQPPAGDAEIVAAARRRLLAGAWDLALCPTELPLTVARRPVVAHASAVHGVGVISLPALGPVGMRRRILAWRSA